VSTVFRYINVHALTSYTCYCIYNIYHLYRTKWVQFHGHEYKTDAGVIIEVRHDLPVVGRIEDIF